MLTDHRKIVAWLVWALSLPCVVLCAPLLRVLNGRILIGFIREGTIVVLVIRTSSARSSAPPSFRLRDEVDVDTLSSDVAAAVRETVQPVRVSLWLQEQGEDGEGKR